MRIPLWKRSGSGSGIGKYILPKRFQFYIKVDEKPIRMNIGPLEIEFDFNRNIDLGKIKLVRKEIGIWKLIVQEGSLNINSDAFFIPILIARSKEIGIEAADYAKPIGVILAMIIGVIAWVLRKK